MFRREHQECTAVNRVGARSKNANLLIYILNLKSDPPALASANPGVLEQLNSLGPIQFVEPIEQSLRKSGDTQHPLPHRSSHNRKAANLAFSVYNLLVRQDRAQLRTPVHRDICDIRQPDTIRVSSAIGGNRLGPICLRVEPGVVNLQENTLAPL